MSYERSVAGHDPHRRHANDSLPRLGDCTWGARRLFRQAAIARRTRGVRTALRAPHVRHGHGCQHRQPGAAILNQGLARTWNLTALAGQVVDGTLTAEEFARRNISSASIPVAFPPQVIDGNVYVDGGTTGDILFLDAFDQESSAVQRWAALHPGVPLAKVRLWVIADTSIVPPPVAPDTRDLAVAKRAIEISVLSGLNGQLARLDLIARWLHAACGLDVEFRYVALPDGYVPKGPGLFNKTDMDFMSDLGHRMGRDPSSWRTSASDARSPDVLRQELRRRLEASGAG